MHAPDPNTVVALVRPGASPETDRGSPATAAVPGQLAHTAARAHAIAWISILCGMIVGLWSFDGPLPVPSWIGGYGDLSRRFIRLAHIAMFALGMLHIMLAKRLEGSTMPISHKRSAYFTMAAGNIVMPLCLIGASIWEPLKYLTTLPAAALTTAFAIVAQDAVRAMRRA